jgi:GntR family transcriptional regulator, vanillate catabolism transcriptional regulator
MYTILVMRTDFVTTTQPPGGDPFEEGGSQAVKVQLKLREMVLAGELKAGARITELALVEKLGVSRTPIRAALIRLEQEGLLQQMPSGGFAVRKFSEADVADAIELRGTVEGLAVRLAAERGVSSDVLAQADQCLDGIDRLLQEPVLNEEAFSRYVDLNAQFHALLGALAASPVIQGVQANSPKARDMLIVAQDQHRQVMQAIGQREGARAEAVMREHSRLAQRNLREAVRSPLDLPGAHLISPSS